MKKTGPHSRRIKGFDPYSFSVINALTFFAASAYVKTAESLILLQRGETFKSLPHEIYMLFYPDMQAAIVVFLISWAIFARTQSITVRRAAYILQFIYCLYAVAYVEFFRHFGTQLNISFLLAIPSLLDMIKPTLETTWASLNRPDVWIEVLAAITVPLWLLPKMTKVKIKKPAGNKMLAAAALMLLATTQAVSYVADGGNQTVSKYDLDRNPLLNLIQSAYNRATYYKNLQYEENGPVSRREDDAMIIDPRYPLMGGSAYAICNHPKLKNRFSKLCSEDVDGDGYDKTQDCDDKNPNINPAAKEIPYNLIDENCNPKDNPQMNVILVVLESVDAKDMQLYGAEVDDTPDLMRYRNISFVSYNFRPNSDDSSRGEISSYCSIYPYEDALNFDLEAYYVPCFPDILKSNRYRTAYYAPYSSVDERGIRRFVEMRRGAWDVFMDKKDFLKDAQNDQIWGVDEESMLPTALRWISSDREIPFFMVMRFSTGHEPIKLQPKYQIFNNSAYNAAFYADKFIGNLTEELRESDMLDNTLIIIESDHTRERFDHGRIPFVMINPLVFKDGKETDKPASQIDIAPTILGILGIQSINAFQGKNILDDISPERRIFYTYTSGALGFYEGNNTLSYDINKNRIKLLEDEEDVTEAKKPIAEKLYQELISWKNSQRRLYTDGHLFNTNILTYEASIQNESCWHLRNTLKYQWASNATASSNEEDDPARALGATGPPDTPACSRSKNAWSPRRSNSHEWLETYYDTPIHAESLVICENDAAPFVRKVELIDTEGGRHRIWDDRKRDDNTRCDGRFEIRFNRTEYLVKGVYIDTATGNDEQIDAVGIR